MKSVLNFLFKNQNVRQTIAKNTFWTFLGEIGGRVARAAIVIYAARILGAAGWGAFSYAISLAALFNVFSDIGISAILTREAAKNELLRSKYFSTTFFIKLILVILGSASIIFVAPYFTKIEEAKNLLLIVAFVLFFDSLRVFGFSLNNAIEKMEVNAGNHIFTNLAITGLGIAFLLTSPTSRFLAISYLIGSGAGFLLIVWNLRKYFKNIISNFSKELLLPIIKSAWPFALFGILGGIMINTDTIMLGWMRSAAEVGFYSAAQRPVLFLYALPSLLAISVFPNLARWANPTAATKLRLLLERSLILIFAISLPISLGGIILGPEIINVIYGSSYQASILSFQILMISLAVNFPSTLISNAIFAYDRQKHFIGFVALGTLSNVILNYLLIPRFGIYGASAATFLAQSLAVGFIWKKMKKINHFEVLPHLKKIILATFVMGLFVVALKYLGVVFYLNIIISAMIYFFILYLFKEPILFDVKKSLKLEKI